MMDSIKLRGSMVGEDRNGYIVAGFVDFGRDEWPLVIDVKNGQLSEGAIFMSGRPVPIDRVHVHYNKEYDRSDWFVCVNGKMYPLSATGYWDRTFVPCDDNTRKYEIPEQDLESVLGF